MTEGPFGYDARQERRARILDRVREAGFLSVADLSRDLGVSEMTVRRDIRRLEAEGEVRAVHGGVSLPRPTMREPSFLARTSVMAEAKRAIGAAAVTLIEPGSAIALDAGTTAYAVARELPSDANLTVVTHNLAILCQLSGRRDVQTIGLSGELSVYNQAFIGPMTVAALGRLRVRTFFLSAVAVDEHGIYTATGLEIPTKTALMHAADRVVLVVDSSKFKASAPVILTPLSEADMLVTELMPPQHLKRHLDNAGIELLHADA